MSSKSLIRVLTEAGAGSRRRMADAIKQGRVEVNGEIAEAFSQPVDINRDSITIDGRTVDIKPPETICLMLNKPAGVVSTASDEKSRSTVLDILPARYRRLRLYPVGRLDIDTTGLILLTNDGDLTYRLTHPSFEIEKEYLVQIRGHINRDEMKRLQGGIKLEDGPTRPARVHPQTLVEPYNYSIIIHEGRKRQVRRMFERLGHPVLALQRVRIGSLHLGDLKEGMVRRVTKREMKELLAGTG